MNKPYIDIDGSELTIEIDKFNTIRYYNSTGLYHRLDGPAIEYKKDISYIWYKNGKQHRVGGSAVCYNNLPMNYKSWNINDKKVEVYYICG